jgi:hypothetical protein
MANGTTACHGVQEMDCKSLHDIQVAQYRDFKGAYGCLEPVINDHGLPLFARCEAEAIKIELELDRDKKYSLMQIKKRGHEFRIIEFEGLLGEDGKPLKALYKPQGWYVTKRKPKVTPV